MKWEQWWPLYKDTIHSQDDLDDKVKCLALHGLLQGKALDLCFTSLPVSAASYQIVIKRLHDNFGKPELLMAELLQESTDFAKQLDENSHTSLLNFQSKLQDLQIRFLKLARASGNSEEVSEVLFQQQGGFNQNHQGNQPRSNFSFQPSFLFSESG